MYCPAPADLFSPLRFAKQCKTSFAPNLFGRHLAFHSRAFLVPQTEIKPMCNVCLYTNSTFVCCCCKSENRCKATSNQWSMWAKSDRGPFQHFSIPERTLDSFCYLIALHLNPISLSFTKQAGSIIVGQQGRLNIVFVHLLHFG